MLNHSPQCSPHSEAQGIERVFESAEKFASNATDRQANRVMPVVVLDEIGLAEDSPKMPLKALHSLLEQGNSNKSKIGFIGISNWALGVYCVKTAKNLSGFAILYFLLFETFCEDLTTGICTDPAKMNRGLYVTRQVPDYNELKLTAEGICEGTGTVVLTIFYLAIFHKDIYPLFLTAIFYPFLKGFKKPFFRSTG